MKQGVVSQTEIGLKAALSILCSHEQLKPIFRNYVG